MSTRLLYLFALIFMGIAVLFYSMNRDKTVKPVAVHSDIDYIATNISARQTDDQGLIESEAQAQTLRHYPKNDQLILDHITSTWFKQGQPNALLNADQGTGFDNNQKVILSGNVHVQELAMTKHAPVDLYTTSITGYPPTKKLETDQLVTIKSGSSSLVSQGANADLNSGQYEFFKPRGIYVASPRP